jgi:hypothetical protein
MRTRARSHTSTPAPGRLDGPLCMGALDSSRSRQIKLCILRGIQKRIKPPVRLERRRDRFNVE